VCWPKVEKPVKCANIQINISSNPRRRKGKE
jgi:hypothetical protein